jgi:glutamyl-tRNA synthetase
MLLGPDGQKLSKRHGAVSVMQYHDDGYLPEALLNYLARLGWSHGDQEIFTLEEMIGLFDIVDCNKSASAINYDKLLWTNQQHMMRATPARLARYLRPQLAALGIADPSMPQATLEAIAVVQRERSRTLKEMAEASVFFFREPDGYEPKAAAKHLTAEAGPLLAAVAARLQALPEAGWQPTAIHEAISAIAEGRGLALGKVAQPIRVAVSGGSVSPPIDATLAILGRASSLARIQRAQAFSGG